MFSSTIWLRMKSTSDSMTFCSPAGTSLGVRKASQNSNQTRPATRKVCSTTRLMPRLTPNSSRSTRLGHSNSSMPGAWNPSRASPIMDAVILAAPSAAAVPLDDQVERARRPDEDADRDQEAGAQPPVQQPADPAPGEDPCDQRAEDRPDDVAAAAAGAARSFASTHGRANLSPRPRRLLVGLHRGDARPHREADLGGQVDAGPGDQREGERPAVEGGGVPQQEQQHADGGDLDREGEQRRRQQQVDRDPAGGADRQQGGGEERD